MRLRNVRPGKLFVFVTCPGTLGEKKKSFVRQPLFVTDRYGNLWVFTTHDTRLGWYSFQPIEPISENREIVAIGLPPSLDLVLREYPRGPKNLHETDLQPSEEECYAVPRS